MSSSATLTSLRTRVRNFLMDATKTVWASDDQIDEGLRLALEEVSRLGPKGTIPGNNKIGTVTPGAGAREVSLAGLAGLLDVVEVWFPYTAASPENPPGRVDYIELANDGAVSLFLLGETAGDGVKVARVFYRAMHTLNGLDGAGATTFPASADGLLATGAAGHCCLMRAVDLSESTTMSPSAVPNLGELGVHLLSDFRAGLGLGAYVDDSSFSLQQFNAALFGKKTTPPKR